MNEVVRPLKYTKQCLICGGSIVGRRVDAKYCGNKCANQKRRKSNKEYELRYPERVKANRERQLDKAEKRMLTRVKCRAKREGTPFNLCELDIIIPEFCPVLGIKINPRNKGTGYHPDSPSLDRVYPDRGYLKGNVRVISARANLLKNNATVEELERVVDDLKRLYK